MSSYKTVKNECVFELTEKRSRFIATLIHVESEEEAAQHISAFRGRYWDARHNVYAYSLAEGNLKRFSDDGEPHGTAGKPVLDVIEGAGLKNVLLIVTRYFGGVLLGTGGLVRAYSGAAQGVVAAADIKTMTLCREIEIECDYSLFDSLENTLKGIDGGVLGTQFSNNVCTNIYINDATADAFCERIIDQFCGKVTIKTKNQKFYPI